MMSVYEYKIASSLAMAGVPVFPLAENTTVPLKGSNGYKDATTDNATIDEWFNNQQHYNVGMALKPINVLVVDLDRHHASGIDGVESYRQLANRFSKLPTETYMMTTPRGGLHYFFRYPAGYEIPSKPLWQFSSALSAYKGIDIVTYSTPGKLAKTPKGTYKVLMNGCESPLQSADCPQWLLNLLTSQPVEPEVTKPVPRKTWTGRLMDEVFQPTIEEGTRNVALTSLCGKLIRTTAESSTVYEALLTANDRLANPLATGEVNQIFRSVLKREQQKLSGGGISGR